MSDFKKHQEEAGNITNVPQNPGRRKAVKTIVGGVGALAAYHVMPTNWSKPIIEQVFLPAHAATSGTSLVDPCTLHLVSGTTASSTVVVHLDGFVVPATSGLPVEIVATPAGAGTAVTTNTTTVSDGTFDATINIVGGPGITSVSVVTTVTGAAGSASCSVEVPTPTPETTSAPTTTPTPEETTTPEPTTSPPA